MRFVAIAYVMTASAIVASHGKDYYLAAAVPAMFVLGAVALQHAVRSVGARAAYGAIAIVTAVPLLPLALPILPLDRIVAYERAIHLAPQQQERGDASGNIPSLMADMTGWHEFARKIGIAYDSLPPGERRVTSILADNYGEAAAIDLNGSPYRLPRALSGHNQYYLWGPVPDAQSTNALILQDRDDLAVSITTAARFAFSARANRRTRGHSNVRKSSRIAPVCIRRSRESGPRRRTTSRPPSFGRGALIEEKSHLPEAPVAIW